MPKVHVVLGFEESVNALVMVDEALDSELAALNESLIQAMVDIIDLDERLSQMEINGNEYDIQDNCINGLWWEYINQQIVATKMIF